MNFYLMYDHARFVTLPIRLPASQGVSVHHWRVSIRLASVNNTSDMLRPKRVWMGRSCLRIRPDRHAGKLLFVQFVCDVFVKHVMTGICISWDSVWLFELLQTSETSAVKS
jgi:hypothetical protein